jgi:antitoxin component YwqK of YwqJK toxin-antitoxin module
MTKNKYLLFLIIVLTSCKEPERELVFKYQGFKKHLVEKYYKVKDKKNSLGEDVRDGLTVNYYLNGYVNGVCFYDNDYLSGWETIYDEDGRKLTEKLWEPNRSKGTSETIKIINYGYYDNNKLESIIECDVNGKVVSTKSYDKTGKFLGEDKE